MNPLFERLMRSATRLTQRGNLQEATRAIQRALGAASRAQQAASTRDADFEVPTARAANDDRLVVDVEARVIEMPFHAFDAPHQAAFEPDVEVGREAKPAVEQWADGLFAHQHRQVAYKLFVPVKGTGEARPLVLMLHGCSQHPEDFAAGTQMNRLAREHGFLVLYPAQTQRANSSKCWNWFKPQHQQRGRGEPALLAALTQSVIDAQSVDPRRVYVAGLSAGGAMADIVGRAYPDVFAAVGVHSGLPTGAASDLMSALAAMNHGSGAGAATGPGLPTIVFHGDADATVHVSNGAALVDAALAAPEGMAAPSRVTSGRSAHGRAFTRSIHAEAEGRPAVEHWLLHGAGHAWAGGHAGGSFTDPSGPDASAEMLRFFLAHPRPASGKTH